MLLIDAKQPKPGTKAPFEQYTDAQLAEIAGAPAPSIKRHITDLDELQIPEDPEEARKYFERWPNSTWNLIYDKSDENAADLGGFLKAEGVAAVLRSDSDAEPAGSFKTDGPMAPPTNSSICRTTPYSANPVGRSAPPYGVISSTSLPSRQIQFALKLIF